MNRRLADCCSLQGPFPVIDSKKLYHQGNLSPLERSLFLALSLLAKGRKRNPFFNDFYPVPSCFEGVPNDGRENAPPLSLTFPTLLLGLTFATKNPFPIPPWEKNGDISLPVSPKFPLIESFLDDVDRVGQIFQNAGIDLLGIKSRRIQPLEFNALLDQTGLKSDLLAEETLSLASRMVTPILNRIDRRFSEKEGKEPIFLLLLCDKLGGRNRYRDRLDRHFPSIQLRTITESRPLSVYRSDRNVPVLMEVRFQAKGESNLRTALASIASKYLREISMIPFNRFWTSQIPDLKPTAGYPVDAKRFRTETETLRQSLSIPDKEFWRNK